MLDIRNGREFAIPSPGNMLAEITAALTVVSSMIGISKGSIDLRNKAKQLFESSDGKILGEIAAAKKGFRKGDLEQVYLAVSESRPLAHSLFQKLRNNFAVSAVIFVGSWSYVAYLIYKTGSPLFERVGLWAPLLIVVIGAVVYGSKNLFWPPLKQIPTALRLKANEYLDTRGLVDASQQLKERSFEIVSRSAGIFGLRRISVRERAFLNTFARLTALLNALESYVLIEKMGKSFAVAYEWFSGEMLDIVVRTIESLVELKRLVPKPKEAWGVEAWHRDQERTLRQEFRATGMEDLFDPEILGTSYSMFFDLDFAGLVQSDQLADELRKYISLGDSRKSQ
jgi:hypothetical protein